MHCRIIAFVLDGGLPRLAYFCVGLICKHSACSERQCNSRASVNLGAPSKHSMRSDIADSIWNGTYARLKRRSEHSIPHTLSINLENNGM